MFHYDYVSVHDSFEHRWSATTGEGHKIAATYTLPTADRHPDWDKACKAAIKEKAEEEGWELK